MVNKIDPQNMHLKKPDTMVAFDYNPNAGET